MSKNILDFICENENITLKEELMQHISKRFYKAIKSSHAVIRVNGIPYATYREIHKGDNITVEYEYIEETVWPLYESQLDIVFEDEYYLVVNKRRGLLAIPTKSEPYSLYQEVLYHLRETGQNMTASILNRLDKDTFGLTVVAKSRLAAYHLQPTHQKMVRKYQCLCHGIITEDEGVIHNRIDRLADSHRRYISETSGKEAISHYRVLKRFEDYTLLEFVLETGRTHQIRLHTVCLGHPILGDTMYGTDKEGPLCLCSYYVRFYHAFIHKELEFSIESGWENGRTE